MFLTNLFTIFSFTLRPRGNFSHNLNITDLGESQAENIADLFEIKFRQIELDTCRENLNTK